MKIEYIVTEKDEGSFVRDIVKKKMNVSSRLYKKIALDIYLNDKKCYATNRVIKKDVVTVYLDNAYDEEVTYDKFTTWKHKLDILYEDEYIICINKESGIACHPSANHQEKTLYNAVINYYIEKGIKVPIHFVNRLDKDTTGVVVIAKHKYVQQFLVKQMEKGDFNKEYIAIVYGKLENKEGIIEKKIKRKDGTIILRETSDSEGEYAKTAYKVLEYNEDKNYTVVKVKLYTGRTHQIRVHFTSIGHPLLGDELYANECEFKIDNIREYIKRQALHAKLISFNHINGKKLIIEADIPEDMSKLINNCSND